MSVLQMSVLDELPEPSLQQRKRWLLRWSRPALGLLLPLGLALGWEISVRAGLFSGRLVPPPSVIYATFVELARTGELQSHALTTLARVAAGFAIGVCVGTLLGWITLGAVLALHRWWWIPLALIIPYALAWISHFFIEHNKPASFGHPLWSWWADQRMVALMLVGKMDEEIRKYGGN